LGSPPPDATRPPLLPMCGRRGDEHIRQPSEPRTHVPRCSMAKASRLETVHEQRLELAPVLAAHSWRPDGKQQAIEQAGGAHGGGRQGSFLRMRFARAAFTRRACRSASALHARRPSGVRR
jgi:hypothetical protein